MTYTKIISRREWESIGRIVLLAAFADGKLDDGERRAFQAMTEGWVEPERKSVLSPVFANATRLEEEARLLSSSHARRLAFRTAREMCRADGAVCEAEERFLGRLMQCLNRSDVV